MQKSVKYRPNVYVLASNEWHTPWWMSRQHLFSRLAVRGWRVIYTTGLQSAWERTGLRWERAGAFHRFDYVSTDGHSGNLQLDNPGRLLAEWPRVDVWSRAMKKLHARHLLSGFGDALQATKIIFITHPRLAYYVDLLGEAKVVFYIHDAYEKLTTDPKHMLIEVARLSNRADMLIATGDTMLDTLPLHHRERTRILPHAVDFDAYEFFRAQPIPKDLETISGPRVGYVGRINPKLDLTLLADLADNMSDLSFVFVGQVFDALIRQYPELEAAVRRLRQTRNVHFLGPRPADRIAGYTSGLDVCLSPFRKGTHMDRSTPTKTLDYFAAGKPMVTVTIPSMESYRELVYFADDPGEWIGQIRKALAEQESDPRRNERIAIARANTWEQRTIVLEKWLSELC